MGVNRSVIVSTLLGMLVVASAANAGTQVTPNSVTLTWTTTGDDSLVGIATQFDLRYSTSPITAANFASATAVSGLPAPGAPGTPQSFTVTALQPSTLYYFALKTLDDAGNWSAISNSASKTTLTAPDVTRPAPIASLVVSAIGDTTATLGWSAVGDDSLTGTATSYDIRYSTQPITATSWTSAAQGTAEPVPAAPGTAQSYQVKGLARQSTYYFAIKTTDDAGNVSALSNVPTAITTDTMPPAAIRDLVASFVWIGWHTTGAVRARGVELPR